jgi:outer membrane protein assembly factor BamB
MDLPAPRRSNGATRSLVLGTTFVLSVALAACTGSAGTATASQPAASPGTKVPSSAPIVSPPVEVTASPIPAASAQGAAGTSSLKLLWQKSGPSKAKTETYWPAIDPITGDVWVASSFDNQYWIFRPDGTFVESWGTPGSGPGQLALTTHDMNPDGVGALAFAPDGSFYIADNGNYRVERFDARRRFVASWGSFGTGQGQFTSPKGIATDGKTVYVADDRGDVQAFDTNGHFVRSFPIPFVLFALTPSGDLISTDSAGVIELDSLGRTVTHTDLDFASLGGNGSQVALDHAGNRYVGIQNDGGPVALVELSPDGSVLHSWSNGAETLAIPSNEDAIYMAFTNAGDSGWPFLRKYALPAK